MSDTKVEKKQRFSFVIKLNTFSDSEITFCYFQFENIWWIQFLLKQKWLKQKWSKLCRCQLSFTEFRLKISQENRYVHFSLSPENVTVKQCAFLFIIPKLNNFFLVSVRVNHLRILDVFERLTSETSSKGAFPEKLLSN